ncbi:MAG: hypothetical protein RID15_04190 [Marinovum algicola]|jgi:hypothetical protein|nr:hypothetical protein [Marinovum algicola]
MQAAVSVKDLAGIEKLCTSTREQSAAETPIGQEIRKDECERAHAALWL